VSFIFQKKHIIIEGEVNPKIDDSYLILKKHSILMRMDTNKRIIRSGPHRNLNTWSKIGLQLKF